MNTNLNKIKCFEKAKHKDGRKITNYYILLQYIMNILFIKRYNDNYFNELKNNNFNIEQVKELYKIIELENKTNIFEIYNEIFDIIDIDEQYIKNSCEIIELVTDEPFSHLIELLSDLWTPNFKNTFSMFLSPYELSDLFNKLSKNITADNKKVCDLTCGCGDLLSAFNNCLLYGQDINPVCIKYAKMNLILLGHKDFNLYIGDTLTNNKLSEKFDVIVCNPPFNVTIDKEYKNKFQQNNFLLPLDNGQTLDYFFINYALNKLNDNGKIFFVLCSGALYQNKNKKARELLLPYIETVIKCPKKIFLTTTTDIDILILNKTKDYNDILFIDASDFYKTKKVLQKNINQLINIDEIVKLVNDRQPVNHISCLVQKSDLVNTNYLFTVNLYVNNKLIHFFNKKDLFKNKLQQQIKINENLIKILDYNFYDDLEYKTYFLNDLLELVTQTENYKNIDYKNKYFVEKSQIDDITEYTKIISTLGEYYIHNDNNNSNNNYKTFNHEIIGVPIKIFNNFIKIEYFKGKFANHNYIIFKLQKNNVLLKYIYYFLKYSPYNVNITSYYFGNIYKYCNIELFLNNYKIKIPNEEIQKKL